MTSVRVKSLLLGLVCCLAIASTASLSRVLASCSNNPGGSGGDDIECSGDNTGTNAQGNNGDDTITIDNDTTVNNVDGGNNDDTLIIGDNSSTNNIIGGSGNDTIEIGNDVTGNNVNGGDGNDDVTIGSGADVKNVNVGDGDNVITLTGDATLKNINGGSNDDTIKFKFKTSDKDAKSDFQDQLDTIIANGSGGHYSGSVTFNGFTYNFSSIEQLLNLIQILSSGHSSNSSGVPVDPRLNRADIGFAPVAVYCRDGQIEVYSITADGTGMFAVAGTALGLAGGTTYTANGVTITYDASSGNAIVTDGSYVYAFAAATCAA